MTENYDRISTEELRSAFASLDCVRRFYYFEELGSTSDWARELVLRANGSAQIDGTLVLANNQTKGRGRFGRQWISAPGKSLLFTQIRRSRQAFTQETLLSSSLAPALAVCAAVEHCLPSLSPGLKYPNDVLLNGRKIAGTLVEKIQVGEYTFFLTGVGINVNQCDAELPHGSRWPVTSLFLNVGFPVNRVALLREILQQMSRLSELASSELLAQVNSRCSLLGTWVRIETATGMLDGVAEQILPDGSLVLRNPSLPGQHIHTGEVRTVSLKSSEPNL